MERQNKSLRNLDVVNEDKINELPEELLVQILSSLPTDNVTATSVLSKRWRSLWKMVPCLEFDSFYHKSKRYRFSENVYRSLVLHNGPFLESLDLTVGRKCDALDIEVLIGTAFERHVRKLGLDISYMVDIGEEDPVLFPSVLFSCNNTLENLELKNFILLHFPFRVCLKSLRKLHLYYVEFLDEESVCNFLCGCSNLEDLIVNCIGTMHSFAIAVPSLQRLTIVDGVHVFRPRGYMINAPCLKYLNVRGLFCHMFFLIENAPELLEEAKITDVCNAANENLLASLTSVKRLSLQLSPLEIKYPTGNIVFYQLVSLELASCKRKWWNLLSLMLDSSPKLQILKLIDPNSYDKYGCLVDWEWKRPKSIPDCLLFHLETFTWIRYDWQREDEEKVATYILQNARRLKKATISTEPIEPEEIKMLKKRRERLNELASLVRSSNSCLLDFY